MTPLHRRPVPIDELDHERIDELEERAERTDIRDGLSLLLSMLAAGAAITADRARHRVQRRATTSRS